MDNDKLERTKDWIIIIIEIESPLERRLTSWAAGATWTIPMVFAQHTHI